MRILFVGVCEVSSFVKPVSTNFPFHHLMAQLLVHLHLATWWQRLDVIFVILVVLTESRLLLALLLSFPRLGNSSANGIKLGSSPELLLLVLELAIVLNLGLVTRVLGFLFCGAVLNLRAWTIGVILDECPLV